MRPYRIVCVLSGGGTKAAAHVGALRALADMGFRPSHYVGTSMGAVIAACFASGLDYEDVLERILLVERADVASLSPSLLLGPFARSLFAGEQLRETIAELVPARRFDQLEVPLSVTAVDAGNGQLTVFGAGGRSRVPLIDALYASCALPVYYPPARIGDRAYVDGGLRAVLPLDVAARFDPDLLYAVHVGPWLLDDPPERPNAAPPLLEAYNRATRVLMAAQTEALLARWRNGAIPFVFVKPAATQQATFRVEAAADYVAEGYRAAVRTLFRWLGKEPSTAW